MKRVWIVCICLLTSSLAAATEQEEAVFQKLETFSKVLGFLQQNYIDPTNDEEQIEQAIKGLVSNLDPHTTYLTKEEYSQMKVDTSGKFGGIGIELGMNENKELIVIKPLETGPAIQKGIKAGDRIVEVDGESTDGWAIYDAVKKLRGPKGTYLNMKLVREGETDPYEVSIKRSTIYLHSVAHKILLQEYGYIQIKSFQDNTDDDVLKAYEDITKDLRKKKRTMKGLILDLRNNPGGLLDQAIRITDLFIEKGVIVSTKGRTQAQVEINYAKKEGTLPYVPMAVLINDGTASASEIVAGALQDHLRAALIGTPTFGKGSVQTIIDLDDGSGLKMTVARYYTPNDRPIQNVGNTPDLYVSYFNYRPEDEYFRREIDLEGSIDTLELNDERDESDDTLNKILDPQLKASIEYLQTREKFQQTASKSSAAQQKK